MRFLKFLLLLSFIALPLTASADYKTIDELAKAYSDETCKTCHAKAYDEWKTSFHSQSVVHSVGGIRNFIKVGLEKEWNKPVTKEHVMRCMFCHAPVLKDASEPLIKEVANLIVTAVDGKHSAKKEELKKELAKLDDKSTDRKDEINKTLARLNDEDDAKKAAAKKELSKLNVNCITCHNLNASMEKNLKGAPKPGVWYGPTGKATPDHPTEKSSTMSTAMYCGQCHGNHVPPDGDTILCNTLYMSYENGYKANGGTETCQDCHMRKNNRGHSFPGAYQGEMVKEGILLDAQVAGIKLHPGKWIPTAIVNVGLINKAGHRIPDG